MKALLRFLRKLHPIRLYKWIARRKEEIRLQYIRSKFFSCGENTHFGTFGLQCGWKYISIGEGTCFGGNLYLTAWDKYPTALGVQVLHPEIKIGRQCNFGPYNHITSTNSITIGNGVLTGKWVTITDNSHGDTSYESLQIPPHKRELYSKGPVVIKDNVWIGDKATILPGVTIGEGTIVAANTVVTKDVPAYCIVAGIPGRVIKEIRKH